MISAIFCTHLRYDMLGNAVKSLIDSDGFDRQLCQVIVVDNSPEQARQDLNFPSDVRVVFCNEVGLSNARNAGIAASDADIIAFIDDDALVEDGWVPAVLNAFSHDASVMICGGRTKPLYQVDKLPDWWSEDLTSHLSCIDWGDELRPLKPGEWVVGANVAYRADVFRRYGAFNPSLGRQGNMGLLSNEETAISKAVGLSATFYSPKMEVKHIIPPSRMQQTWFRKRVAWQAISDALSGEGFIDPKYAWQILHNYVLNAPAEMRSTRSLYYQTSTPKAFKDQLQALYAHGVLYCAGFIGAEDL